jgi:L-ascorbate oxidase
MTVVQADGNNVQPVKVDEFRIGVAETYDVIVKPKDAEAYTSVAESMGGSGFARETLAVENGVAAPVPELRDPARLTMADMGMDHSNMAGMDHSNMAMSKTEDKFYADGSGLIPKAANGGKFLSYSDLKAQKPLYEDREPTREIELRLTGNMERYLWSINGVKYENAEPIRLQYGERVRFKFVNETMMTHPMHLHGMWSILDVGADQWNPIKHTVSVQPGTTVYTETEVDEPGQWAFHCHLAYHASAGMFRKIIVEGGPEIKQAKLATTVTPGGDS